MTNEEVSSGLLSTLLTTLIQMALTWKNLPALPPIRVVTCDPEMVGKASTQPKVQGTSVLSSKGQVSTQSTARDLHSGGAGTSDRCDVELVSCGNGPVSGRSRRNERDEPPVVAISPVVAYCKP